MNKSVRAAFIEVLGRQMHRVSSREEINAYIIAKGKVETQDHLALEDLTKLEWFTHGWVAAKEDCLDLPQDSQCSDPVSGAVL